MFSKQPVRAFQMASLLRVHQTNAQSSSVLFSKAATLSTSFDRLNLKSLQKECLARGIKKSGRKMELVHRLIMFDATNKVYSTSSKGTPASRTVLNTTVDAVKLPSLEERSVSSTDASSPHRSLKSVRGVIADLSSTQAPSSPDSQSTSANAQEQHQSPSLPEPLVVVNNSEKPVLVGSEIVKSTPADAALVGDKPKAAPQYPETFGEFVRCLVGWPPKPETGKSLFSPPLPVSAKPSTVKVEHNPKDFAEFVTILFGKNK